MSFSDMEGFVKRLLPDRTVTKHGLNFYYCIPQQCLNEGLSIVHNDGDYKEFIETAMKNDNSIDVYVDHYNEPLFDWIEEEDPEGEAEEDTDDDVDSVLSSDDHVEHEKDPFLVPNKRVVHDTFLNALCPENAPDEQGDDEEDPSNEDPTAYPVHDDTVAWDKQVPLLGMKFTDSAELKRCISNYAVKNGYDLWYETNRIHVMCGKNKEPSCPFRLWASWMKNERTFQIKSLKDTHNCARVFKLGSIVTYKWIGTQFVNQILKNPKMPLRKMKAAISEKFMLNVSLG